MKKPFWLHLIILSLFLILSPTWVAADKVESSVIEFPMDLPAGWSMISLPVIPDNSSVSNLFPGAVVVYGYQQGVGYVRKQTLEVGKGYWILLLEEDSYTLTGQPIPSYTLPIDSDGWFMIGGCTGPAKASVDTGNIGVIYKYTPGLGYQRVSASENLAPGQGYWILLKNIGDQATLTVNMVPPVITAHPSDQTVTAGETATFSVTATGSAISYQWQKDTSDISGATEPSYTIPSTTVSDCGSYTCVVSNPGGSVTSNAATLIVNAIIPDNTTVVTNITAVWDQGQARLTWDPVDDVRYRIHRGTSQDAISALAGTDTTPFVDTTAHDNTTYYYQVATIKAHTQPCTGETVQRIGPLSAIVTLEALSITTMRITGAQVNPDGTYTMLFGPTGPYTVTGTYETPTGPVSVSATSGDLTVSGSGSDGSFTILLPCGGDWEIIIKDDNQTICGRSVLHLIVDDQPPTIALDGSDAFTTDQDTVVITGSVSDAAGIDSVKIASDQFPGTPFQAVVSSKGTFSAEIPVNPGENHLTVRAQDAFGNLAEKIVTVTVSTTVLPEIVIHTPQNHAVVSTNLVTVSGTVYASLPPDQIRVTIGTNLQYPQGTDGEYNFTFEDIILVEGPNVITVRAETVHGTVSAQTTVTYQPTGDITEPAAPTIEIESQGPEIYVTEDAVCIKGTAGSEFGVQTITVNGTPVDLVGTGTTVSFESIVDLSDITDDELVVVVVVTDSQGQTSTVTYTVYRDQTSPVISFTSPHLVMPPSVNTVNETPYHLSGIILENHLAGVTVDGTSITVLPQATEYIYAFDVRLDLVRGEERTITVRAWDAAGNVTTRDLIFKLDTTVDIEVITPLDRATLVATDQILDVEVVARIAGLAAGDTVTAQVDTEPSQTLSLADATATGTLSIPPTEGLHTLSLEVTDASAQVIGRQSTQFTIVNTETIALTVDRHEPEKDAQGIEPNTHIAFYFNKPIDPALLNIEVLETAHGKTYKASEMGADIKKLSVIELVEVHRDLEPVPGGISYFPHNTMVAFYPAREFAYGAIVYVALHYDGEERARWRFFTRPLPTLVEGIVADQFTEPASGIQVAIPELGRTAVTDANGAYAFGFGENADASIPGGRYRAVINPGMKNRAFGSVAFWLHIEEGALNTVGLKQIPIINPDEPFRYIESGQQEPALLAAGELVLDVSNTTLTFPGGLTRGSVHVQFMDAQQFGYQSYGSHMAHWAFVANPIGIEVAGDIGITIAIPTFAGSHDYLQDMGEYVILVGLHPDALQLVPVGVGLIDTEQKQVISQGKVWLECLDYIGYAVAPGADDQEILERYVNGEITMREMIGELETN